MSADIHAALERLVEALNDYDPKWDPFPENAMTAARAALAEPVGAPVPEVFRAAADALARWPRPATPPASEPAGEGPPAVTTSALLHPAYEPGDGSADGAQLVELAWWHPQFGCDSLQMVVDNARAVLARWGRLIALGTSSEQIPPGPYSEDELRKQWNNQADDFNQWESLDLSEQLAWAQVRAIAADRNRPATPPAPEPGEVGKLVEWLWSMRELAGEHNPEEQRRYDRAATLLQQQAAPAPVAVPVAVSERLPGDALSWWYEPDEDDDPTGYGGNWTLLRIRGNVSVYTHWLPAHAIPLPQAGEGEG
jgi:hypothetical protein